MLSSSSETRPIGLVTSVKGCHVTLGVTSDASRHDLRATVGRLVGIGAGGSYLVDVLTQLEAAGGQDGFRGHATLDLLGEIVAEPAGGRQFRRGVADYPAIDDAAELISSHDLRLIYRSGLGRTEAIGALQIPASRP